MRLVTGDFTGDGRKDVIFEGGYEVYLLESLVANKSFTVPYRGSFEPRKATLVPDYDRKGTIHMSMDGIEMVSRSPVRSDEVRFPPLLGLRENLPDVFTIGIEADSHDTGLGNTYDHQGFLAKKVLFHIEITLIPVSQPTPRNYYDAKKPTK